MSTIQDLPIDPLAFARTANQPLRDYLIGLAPIQPDPPRENVEPPTTVQVGGLTVSREQHRVLTQANTIAALNPSADALWSGGVVQGRSLASGTLAPVPADRTGAPVTLTVDLTPVGGGSQSVVVDSPSHATVTDAVAGLLRTPAVAPVRLAFTVKQFYSIEHAMLSVGASAKWMSGSAKASLEMSSDVTTNNFMVQVTQQYYTISAAHPGQPDAFFAAGVTPADLANTTGPDNPPAYIASITYGRQLYLFARSSVNRRKLHAALYAAFESGQNGGQVSVDAETESVIQESEMVLFAIGGSGAAVLPVATGADKIAAINAYISSGITFDPVHSPGGPISYTASWLRDATKATVSFATDFTVNTVVQIAASDEWKPGSWIFGMREDHEFTIPVPDGYVWDGDAAFVEQNIQEYDQHGSPRDPHSLWVSRAPSYGPDGTLRVVVHVGWAGAGSESMRVLARFVSSPIS